MNVVNAESTDNPNLSATISRWRDAVASTRTALAGWENTATLIGREIGPDALDNLHRLIMLSGENDFRLGMLERLPMFRAARKPRGRAYNYRGFTGHTQ